MITRLRTLGLALAAVFALAALTAAAAHGVPADFKADTTTTNAIYKLEDDPTAREQIFLTEFGEINCNTFSAHGTAHQTATTLTATGVEYSSDYFEPQGPCEAFGLEMELIFGGCDYVFHAGTISGEGESTGTMDIVCPPGQEIEIVTSVCTVSVPGQTGLGSVTYTDGGGSPRDITVDIQVENLVYSGEGLFCSGEFANGVYDGKMTLKAYNDNSEEAQVSATINSAL